MQSSAKKIVGIIVILIVCALAFVFLKPKGNPLVVIEDIIETPAETSYVVGQSVEGRDISVYSYGTGEKHVAFVGGVHGGYEWNGTLLAYTFMDYLEKDPGFIPEGITVDVIPSINPDALYDVIGKEGRFAVEDVSTNTKVLETARFNANNVDLNRNFDCDWQAKSTWRSKEVSAGTEPFSEPEAKALKAYVERVNPAGVVFWHSQANAVYASQCGNGILVETEHMMNEYADAARYNAVDTFDAYAVTGAADDWLAKIGIPAITVELKTHESIEWDKNLRGISALLAHMSGQ